MDEVETTETTRLGALHIDEERRALLLGLAENVRFAALMRDSQLDPDSEADVIIASIGYAFLTTRIMDELAAIAPEALAEAGDRVLSKAKAVLGILH